MLDVPISNVIKRDIILMKPKDTVSNAARVMTKDNSNAVVVVDEGEPVGIVSERDILREVVSKKRKPSEVTLESIMTSPVVTISSGKMIREASELITQEKIRNLVVMDEGVPVAIITPRDILSLSFEEWRFEPEDSAIASPPPEGGICEICGTYTSALKLVNGQFVCDDCKEIMEEEDY
ncbi:MAG: inosine 5'-monophosphate dehydrogenase [Candidatus Methanofastidiosum methylothiophilum]|jgi:CBS domain-containing protein|uniref:Inosine 5'-monophosphate dehydrogenase n=1 Tax=Candidatus Methanofastidiosum methylothiophilum TaxID=1705564 RepID=A0A150JL73_9EURY|nr:MAG: inosine 5'-monophosphate dehydrogenase [Candidatus Methanofastidiosum methylthiophilus]MBP6932926.1 CBS domain-containing protein [Methanofastidiosum sp.]OQC52223.1 MAG: inosine 5'-monophosphate dehydrogenase [Euryarchaeota archaeon ADurb.Bin023]KYC56982.1 MAG: inosine 5'-monophosphate dehydrogenase [Candidatus Methanofastidiosum methylthiophilus]KYC57995.1 MAG: inosine 5'-monophosphate dehydrogenase [Candidatus Methanofastidiosum methylthiophilus]